MSAGKETQSYCTSCKMDRLHIIVAMRGDKIMKVECKSCRKSHQYRPPKGVHEQNLSEKKGSKRTAPKVPLEVEWRKLLHASENRTPQLYQARTGYMIGDRIKHPSFGEGVVTKLQHPNKMEVVFQSDIKILIHGGPK